MLKPADLIASRTYSAIVFDRGDTLLRLDPPREVIFCEAARELDLELPMRDVARAYELVDFSLKMKSSELATAKAKAEFYRSLNTGLCTALGVHSHIDHLHPLLVRRFAERRRWVAFQDAIETLRAIPDGVGVHVLANWDRGLDGLLINAGLREYIGDVAASELLGVEKPARACFDLFLARNSLAPEKTIYVGNEYLADVVGARQAGMTPVLIDRADRLPNADCLRIRALRDLVSASAVGIAPPPMAG
jgi:putative hydrolase of the HAD superfamily